MKIESHKYIKFKDLGRGEVFALGSDIAYIKVFGSHYYNAVRLDTGDTEYHFDDEDAVIWLPTAKLVIE